jgi:hypothetical protein
MLLLLAHADLDALEDSDIDRCHYDQHQPQLVFRFSRMPWDSLPLVKPLLYLQLAQTLRYRPLHNRESAGTRHASEQLLGRLE